MIKLAMAHERTYQEYQIHKQAHSMRHSPLLPITTPMLCYKQALCRSLFRKAFPRRPVANADVYTITVNALPMGLHAASVAKRTTELSNVEALGGGTVGQDVHSLQEGHRSRDKEDSPATSSPTKAGDMEEEKGGQFYKNSTPKRPGGGWEKPHKIATLTVADIPSGPPHPGPGPGTEVVSIKADLWRPAHPPKTAGEQFINTFGNKEYSLTNNKGKAYTDTDSDGKTEIITDITCKFQGKLIAMEVKVDPGSETNCIPLSHFRCLFLQLCSERENTLEPTLA